MTRHLLRAALVAVLVFTGWVKAGTLAMFSDSVSIHNNTFTTGTLQLKLFYDCANVTDETYSAADALLGNFVAGTTGAIVECPNTAPDDGTLERASLRYQQNPDGATYNLDGTIYNLEKTVAGTPTGDWTTTNGWYDSLSSPIDWTNIYPGWHTYGGAQDPAVLPDPTAWTGRGAAGSNVLTVGNAGTLAMSDVTVAGTYELANVLEVLEPLDGVIPGANHVDPLADDVVSTTPGTWQYELGMAYDSGNLLAQSLRVLIERVDNGGNNVSTVYAGTLHGFITGAPLSIGALQPNEVAAVRVNFGLPAAADDTLQGLQFDYGLRFDAAQ